MYARSVSSRRVVAIALVTGLVLAFGPISSEALPVMSISGRVSNMRGEALANAYVRHASAGTYTDAAGAYSLLVTQPGCYAVTASGPSAPEGAYFETTRTICTSVQGTSGQDFRVPYQLYGEAVPGYLNSFEDRSVTQSAMIFCPPESCAVRASLYRTSFGSDLSVLGEFVGTVALAYDYTGADGFAHHQVTIPIPAGTTPGWYQVVREARNPSTDELQSRCMFDRCWNYFAVDNVAPRLGTPTPQNWIKTAAPTIRIPFTDEASVGIDPATARLSLDGVAVPSSALLLEGSLWNGAVTYRPSGLAEGIHGVVFEVADRAGNAAGPLNFGFTVDTAKPAISQSSPTGTIGSCCPRISARIADAAPGQIDPASIVLTLSNGLVTNRLAHTFDPVSGEVAYQVPQDVQGSWLGQYPLAPGTYTVRLSVQDLATNAAETSWTFKVKTTPGTALAWVFGLEASVVSRWR